MRIILNIVLICPLFCSVFSDFPCGPVIYIDITHQVNNDSICYSGYFSLLRDGQVNSVEPFYVQSKLVTIPEHCGTHIDAPIHFNPFGLKLGEIPLSNLVSVNGVIIDVSQQARADPEYAATVWDVLNWERQHGPLPPRAVVIFNFGRAYKWYDRRAYLGLRSDDDWDRHYPGVGGGAAKYLVDTRKVVGVGVDTLSVDSSRNVHRPAHKAILGADLFVLENLALDRISGVPPRGFQLSILPLRLELGTGAPATVLLMVDPKDYRPGPSPFRLSPQDFFVYNGG